MLVWESPYVCFIPMPVFSVYYVWFSTGRSKTPKRRKSRGVAEEKSKKQFHLSILARKRTSHYNDTSSVSQYNTCSSSVTTRVCNLVLSTATLQSLNFLHVHVMSERGTLCIQLVCTPVCRIFITYRITYVYKLIIHQVWNITVCIYIYIERERDIHVYIM